MSVYTNYDSEHNQSYDQFRSAVGVEVIIGALITHLKKPLAEMHVLDAGCGTGNYAQSLLETGVGQITMLDASEDMLQRARVKVAEIGIKPQKVTTLRHQLPGIPFADESFDAVMFNFVLNHLADNTIPSDEARFKTVELAVREAARVLRPGGVLVIQTLTHDQIEKIWCHQYKKNDNIWWQQHFQSNDQIMSMLNDAGLNFVKKFPMLDGPKIWYDPSVMIDGVIDNNAFWVLWTKEEIDACKNFLKKLKAEQKFEKFCSEIEAGREKFADYICVIATK